MGYYSAGGWSAPDFTASPSPGFSVVTAGRGTADPAAGAAGTMTPHDAPRRSRTRVLNLTALARAERRIERATKLAARLFREKKHGHHGLVPKRKRGRK